MESCLPKPFIEKIQKLYADKAESILASFERQRLTSIRVNTLKATSQEVEKFLKKKNIKYEKVLGIQFAFILPFLTPRDITELEIHQEGKIYIQSLSSMLPVIVLDPQPGEHILDMTAAPGSKTTQIAAQAENKAFITANDIDKRRLYKLKAILEQQGAINIDITNIPGQTIWQRYPECFDKVLLDAPCSMEGRFDCHDKESYKHWSQKKVKNLAKLQQWLLRSAVSCTKVGGTIIYSTCTISPEENEGVVNWLLEKEKGDLLLEDFVLSDIPMRDGSISFDTHQYLSELSKTKRILPTEYYEGFYVAKLKKVKSTVSNAK